MNLRGLCEGSYRDGVTVRVLCCPTPERFFLSALAGRGRVPFAPQGMERFFDEPGQLVTARVHRHGR